MRSLIGFILLLLVFDLGRNSLIGTSPPDPVVQQRHSAQVNNTNSIPPEIINNQPRLHIDLIDEERNGTPLRIIYGIHYEEGAIYYTYVYVWKFSDTPFLGRLLGYPNHTWDYEPVIVRIDNITGQAVYIYDKGHYLAGVAQSRELDVKKGSHYFVPSENIGGKAFPRENFEEVTDAQFQFMNDALAGLPSLPFERDLSLDWAYHNPGKVMREGRFSTDRNESRVPVQVNGLGGVAGGATAGAIFKMVQTAAGILPNVTFSASAGIGSIGGLVGGVIGGTVSGGIQNMTLNSTASRAAGTITGAISGAAVGAAIGTIVPGVGTGMGAVIGSICGAFGGLLTSIW